MLPPGGFDDGANIFERLRRFLAHGAVHNVPVAVDRQLPRNKQKATASHGLRIVSAGLGRRVGLDGFTHTDRRTEADPKWHSRLGPAISSLVWNLSRLYS
jgi:hypothetical protein